MPRHTRYPWTHEAGLDAIALRRLGMSYGSIALAVDHFHGFRPSAEAVRGLCVLAGCPTRGTSYSQRPQNFGSPERTA